MGIGWPGNGCVAQHAQNTVTIANPAVAPSEKGNEKRKRRRGRRRRMREREGRTGASGEGG